MQEEVSPSKAGQSLVEFGLVLPILLIVMLGIIEFGKVFSQYFALVYATDNLGQAAARLGGYTVELDVILAENDLPMLDPGLVEYTVNTMDTNGVFLCSTGRCACEYGDVVNVSARYPTNVLVLWHRFYFYLRVQESLFCWRGGAP